MCRLLSEGLATYYGGSGGLTFQELRKLLSVYLSTHPEIDCADVDRLDFLDGKLNPFYVIGALVIENALNRGDIQNMLELCESESGNTVLVKCLGIPKEQLNAHIRKLIDER